MKWLKTPQAAIIWTVLRVWLGIQWVQGGWEKVTGGFDAGGFMQGAIAKAGGENPVVAGWYATFLENIAVPNSGVFSFLVAWGELLVGVGLIVGLATVPALVAGAFMNLNFLMAGTISTNPILLTAAFVLLLVGSSAYYWGGDRFAVAYIKNRFGKGVSQEVPGVKIS